MSSFRVAEAKHVKDVPGQHGPMQVIALTLVGDSVKTIAQADSVTAEWFTKATTPVPTEGAVLDGDLSHGNYGWKFKKAAGAGGGGFNRGPEDPARAKRIVRQHSQHMALLYAQIRQQQGRLPDEFSLDDLLKIADRFDRDAGIEP